ncbi:hypothetical protein [Amycolatopsis sp. NPDC004169]|uniref:hypothetical protein n=1 Tax=Amycolatopsis sp. NPDC004169 TaxID=3154453 RepID=UPI0033BBE013
MNVDFSVDETRILIAAIVRAKFDNPSAFEPYFGSPILAEACKRLAASLVAAYEEDGDSGSVAAWRKWGRWSGRNYEREVIVTYAVELPVWSEWSREEKFEALESFCSPFEPSSSEVFEMIDLIDETRSNS